jgi:hypothetical protein
VPGQYSALPTGDAIWKNDSPLFSHCVEHPHVTKF